MVFDSFRSIKKTLFMEELPPVSVDEVVSGSVRPLLSDALITKLDFNRENEVPDPEFYAAPRLYHHMDPAARYALRLFFEEAFEGNEAPIILDLCSSWASHFPELREFGAVIGVGLNEEELSRNGNLTAFVVHDLNAASAVPGVADAAMARAPANKADSCEQKVEPEGCGPFDFVTCTLGIEYLVRPVDVLVEALRLLKLGGVCILAFTGRSLSSKTVRVWSAATPGQRLWLAATYFRLAHTDCWRFTDIAAIDLSPDPGRSDSLYVVKAVKSTVS